jgi:hypothetical protein
MGFLFRDRFRRRNWSALVPAIAASAVLIVTMPVKYNAGTRHVLVVVPLLAIVAGQGAAYLWKITSRQGVARCALVLLLL